MINSKYLIALGARIKEMRRKRNMTQNDLALRCGFEKASMSRIESGKVNITVLTLQKISAVLEVEMYELFKD